MLHHERATSNHHNLAGVLHLFRGGRWLLSLAKDGSLLCHDLDSPEHEASQLTSSVFSCITPAHSVAMSVDELDNTPTLSARVAIACTVQHIIHPEWVQEEHRIDIWYLRLAFDEPDWGDVQFVAERMAALLVDKDFMPLDQLSLRNREIAFVCKSRDAFTEYVAIVNWSEANGLSTNYPRRYVLTPLNIHVCTSARIFQILLTCSHDLT